MLNQPPLAACTVAPELPFYMTISSSLPNPCIDDDVAEVALFFSRRAQSIGRQSSILPLVPLSLLFNRSAEVLP